MGKNVIIQTETETDPITLMGRMAGLCWNSNTTDHEKNYNRGLECIKSNHGRVMEFPQIYLLIDHYSARVIRELYTHIGGSPTRLQESTRYCGGDFQIVVPPSVEKNPTARAFWDDAVKRTKSAIQYIVKEQNIPIEDAAMLMPLGMETKIVWRTNLRNLVDMSHQRLCSRAYWEFRNLMKDMLDSLAFYSDEWNVLINDLNLFVPKCELSGFCNEKRGCGRKSRREDT